MSTTAFEDMSEAEILAWVERGRREQFADDIADSTVEQIADDYGISLMDADRLRHQVALTVGPGRRHLAGVTQ